MAVYDLSNDFHRARFLARANALAQKDAVVEMAERKPRRTNPQNRYLHAALGYLAGEMGRSLAYVKQRIFKAKANPDLFVIEEPDPETGEMETWLRSSASLTTAEMSLAIDRLRDWAATAGIYLPSPDDYRQVLLMEAEAEQYKRYIQNPNF